MTAVEQVEATTPLTQVEATALDECEQVITAGMEAFVEVGNALATIRDQRLYRTTYATFEAYCQQRWGFGRNRANRLVIAAEITAAIAATVVPNGHHEVLPDSERQVRELAPLRDIADRLAPTWKDAVDRADGGRPSAAHVRAAVAGVIPRPAPRRRPLPDAFRDAVYQLRKAAEQVEKLMHDDRFPAHREDLLGRHRADLAHIGAVLGGVADTVRTTR